MNEQPSRMQAVLSGGVAGTSIQLWCPVKAYVSRIHRHHSYFLQNGIMVILNMMEALSPER